MNQQSAILKFKELGFAPVSNVKDGILLKSKNGVALSYNDGNYEGFIKKQQNQIDEVKLTEAIGLLTIIGLLTTYFTTDVTIIRGTSMAPTLTNNQIIIKSRAARNVAKILVSKNSIIKFVSPQGDRSIKRVVAVPGDEIEIEDIVSRLNKSIKLGNPILKINGKIFGTKIQNNDYYDKYHVKKEKYKLKLHQFFVMGDNKDYSTDSREYGPIEKSNIISIIEK